MTLTFDVIYENGIFRPLEPLPEGLFEEGERLILVIEEDSNEAMIYRKAAVADINAFEVNSNGNPD